MDTAAIILAGGKGTRMKSTDRNKVTLPFHGKPMISYAVELFQNISDPVVVVVGAYAESVKEVLKKYNVQFAMQKDQLGTGDAVKTGLQLLNSLPNHPSHVFVTYGDHSMFYKHETVHQLLKLHIEEHAAVSILTTRFDNPNDLAWGRIVRDSNRMITNIVEQNDATEIEKQIQEVNPGFYCIEYGFLRESIDLIKPSPIKQEYYLTDIVGLAIAAQKKVIGVEVPFEEVGIGINREEELLQSQDLYQKKRN